MNPRGWFIPSIKLKISAVIFLLLALVTLSTSIIVMNIMDNFLLTALVKKGLSVGKSAATVAGYHMLSDDRLAMDNLSANFHKLQDDVIYMAIVDGTGKIRAHSTPGMEGKDFIPAEGETIMKNEDGSSVLRTISNGLESFAFNVPVMFMERKVGDIHILMSNKSLAASQLDARNKIIIVSLVVMALGTLGVFFLSNIFTSPIKKLSDGVIRLSSENYSEAVKVSSNDELGQLTVRFNEMASLITNQKLQLKENAKEIENSYVAMVRLLSTVLDARDKYTLGHSARVSNLSLMLGRNLNLKEEELKDLEVAALFHDIGKLRTPDSILKKSEPLTKEEFLEMMRHTTDGAEILRVVESLQRYIPPVLHHHEWHNGSGYPMGLKGSEIPMLASIISITDAFDAMTSSRPYRPAMEKEAAIFQLRTNKGIQFSPSITDSFMEVLDDYEVLLSHTDVFSSQEIT